MGAEREDTDPTAQAAGGRAAATPRTDPGIGPPSGNGPAAHAADSHEADDDTLEPAPVDFDALHAALGDPIDYQEMPSGPALEKGVDDVDLEVDTPTDPPNVPASAKTTGKHSKQSSDSSGQKNATYASGPHTIPPTRAPNEDMNAPAVIVASDTDTVPSAPPQMTVKQTVQLRGFNPHAGHGGTPPSNPHLQGQAVQTGQPSSGAHPAAGGLGAAYPYTPVPFPAQQPARGVGPSRNAVAQMTMRMPDRPVNPRRQKTQTIVVRARGPSTKQKLLAFMAMLLLVTACGIAVIIWRKPRLLGLEPSGTTPSAGVSGPSSMPSPGVTSPTPGSAITAATSAPAVSATSPASSPGASSPAPGSSAKSVKPTAPKSTAAH